MQTIPMGTTHLPIEDILEYLDSLKAIYTMEVGFPIECLNACVET